MYDDTSRMRVRGQEILHFGPSTYATEMVLDGGKRLVNEAHARAQEVLQERRELLDKLSRVLMATEVIEGTDLKEYAENRKPIPEPEASPDHEQTDQRSTTSSGHRASSSAFLA